MYTTIRLNAGHDRNGNPKRVFVTMHSGLISATYNEGYVGMKAITNPLHAQAYMGVNINVTAKEYKRLVNLFK